MVVKEGNNIILKDTKNSYVENSCFKNGGLTVMGSDKVIIKQNSGNGTYITL